MLTKRIHANIGTRQKDSYHSQKILIFLLIYSFITPATQTAICRQKWSCDFRLVDFQWENKHTYKYKKHKGKINLAQLVVLGVTIVYVSFPVVCISQQVLAWNTNPKYMYACCTQQMANNDHFPS